MKASLFVTCVVDQFYPEVGESAVRVLNRLGVDLDFPSGQTCCGQPAFNSGFWSEAKPLARRFIKQFRDSPYIVIPSGSCAAMIRVFYEELFHDEPEVLEQSLSLRNKVYEFSEFVVDVLGMENLPTITDRSPKTKITYHETCHLRRELGATTQARTLIESVPSADLIEMEQSEVCCGFGGTFAVKYSDISAAILEEKIEHISATGAEALVACDVTCLMQMDGGLKRQGLPLRPLHLAQLLDEATSSP